MAERRMFAKKITESDMFLDMPASSQMLYFHLAMAADDDGFVNNPRKIQCMCGAAVDDMKLLIAKSFVITFESGIIVITHWRMHNYIQKDRYKPSDYIEEKSLLGIKRNREYTLDVSEMDTFCIQTVSTDQCSAGKESIDKGRADECKYELGREKLTLTQYNRLVKMFSQRIVDDVIDRILSHPYMNCLNENIIGKWCAEAKKWQGRVKKNSFNDFEQHDYDFEELERMLLQRSMGGAENVS